MIASVGRAGAGDDRGSPGPGAVSTYLILKSMWEYAAEAMSPGKPPHLSRQAKLYLLDGDGGARTDYASLSVGSLTRFLHQMGQVAR